MNISSSTESDEQQADFTEILVERGVTIKRIRPGTSDGSLDLTDYYRVIVDNPPTRPFYPQGVENIGGENIANIDRHNIQFLPYTAEQPATDGTLADGTDSSTVTITARIAVGCDIRENDEIIFKPNPQHIWIVDKGPDDTSTDDQIIFMQCEIKRDRKNPKWQSYVNTGWS